MILRTGISLNGTAGSREQQQYLFAIARLDIRGVSAHQSWYQKEKQN